MSKVPLYGSFASSAAGVLSGGKEGTYQYATKAVFTGKAESGTEVGLTGAIKDANKVDLDIRLGKKLGGGISGEVALSSAGAAVATASFADTGVPGLKATAALIYPDTADKAKLTLDYAVPHLTSRVVLSNAKALKVDAQVATGFGTYLVGGDVSYDINKGAVTKYSVGAALQQGGISAYVSLLNGSTVKSSVSFSVHKDSTVAGEIVHKLGGETTYAFGGVRKIDSGLYKGKVDSAGIVSLLYGVPINPTIRAEASIQFNAKDGGKDAKTGLAFDVNYN